MSGFLSAPGVRQRRRNPTYKSVFASGGHKSGTRSQGEIGTTLSTPHCCLASTTDGDGDSVGLYEDEGGEKLPLCENTVPIAQANALESSRNVTPPPQLGIPCIYKMGPLGLKGPAVFLRGLKPAPVITTPR